MPISIKEMETNGKEIAAIDNRPVQKEVLALLQENKGQAFMQGEIADTLDIVPQQARQCLIALEKKDKVERKAVPTETKSGRSVDRIHWRVK